MSNERMAQLVNEWYEKNRPGVLKIVWDANEDMYFNAFDGNDLTRFLEVEDIQEEFDAIPEYKDMT